MCSRKPRPGPLLIEHYASGMKRRTPGTASSVELWQFEDLDYRKLCAETRQHIQSTLTEGDGSKQKNSRFKTQHPPTNLNFCFNVPGSPLERHCKSLQLLSSRADLSAHNTQTLRHAFSRFARPPLAPDEFLHRVGHALSPPTSATTRRTVPIYRRWGVAVVVVVVVALTASVGSRGQDRFSSSIDAGQTLSANVLVVLPSFGDLGLARSINIRGSSYSCMRPLVDKDDSRSLHVVQ